MRIGHIFELDASWKDEPPSQIKVLREKFLRAHVEDFFAWVEEQWATFGEQRGFTRMALGYARNQRSPLKRFLDDGRLVLTNNGSERALKTIALGRKAWLFYGSDDHASSAAALYSLIASARLHRLDVEDYLRCLIRLVPLWPTDRMLELAPLFWERTKARLDPKKLAEDLAGPSPFPTCRSTSRRRNRSRWRAEGVTPHRMRQVRAERPTPSCSGYNRHARRPRTLRGMPPRRV